MSERFYTAHWAGLASGPGAWALSTQIQYAATPMSCAHGTTLHIVLSIILAMCSLLGGGLSYAAYRSIRTETAPSLQRAPRLFVATVSMLAAGLFALGILLQGAAGLFLSGCQR
jgi:hypothetical protein